MTDKRSKNPSEEAVQKATDKGWDEWFTLMDNEGCLEMNHTEMAKLLRDKLVVSAWWSQTITVAYERERGLRKVHERVDGFSVGRTRTVDVSRDEVWDTLHDPAFLAEWLPDLEITPTSEKPPQRMLGTLPDGTTLEFALDEKPGDRCMISAAQSKIPDEETAAKMKAAWTTRMDWLRDHFKAE